MSARFLIGAMCAAVTSAASAQSLFATQVVSFQQGTGGGIFVTTNILGAPLGGGLRAGSLDVLTLGDAGSVVLAFAVTIRNGPGADLTVFENGFVTGQPFGGSVFAECAFVEVSTNGTDFARFPSRYRAAPGTGTPMGSLAGLCGGTPILTNANTNTISPFDPAVAGGDSFDLEDLAQHPLVVAGRVNLQAIHYVRLQDVVHLVDVDSHRTPIPGGASADVDGVAVLHHATEPARGPVCDLRMDAQGFLRLRLGDPDGLLDLDVATLQASLNLQPINGVDLVLGVFQPVSFDGAVIEFATPFPIPAAGIAPVLLGISVRDRAGSLCGDQVSLQS